MEPNFSSKTFRSLSALVLVAFLTSLGRPGWAQNAPAARTLVAVLELDAVGSSKEEASAMSDRLREELLRTGKYTLVDRELLNRTLAEQALQQSGCTTQECAVKVGKMLGVQKMISGRVTKLGEDRWQLSATLVDVETSETQRAESVRYRGDYFGLLGAGIVELAQKLTGTYKAPPEAVVQAPPPPPVVQPAVPRAPRPVVQEEPPPRPQPMCGAGCALPMVGSVIFGTVAFVELIASAVDSSSASDYRTQAQNTSSSSLKASYTAKADKAQKDSDQEASNFAGAFVLSLTLGIIAGVVYSAQNAATASNWQVLPVPTADGRMEVALQGRW